jgi:ABC-2 type transport system ATP-binding protein
MEVRKHVGYLPESVPLYRDMTALGFLTYLGEVRGVKQLKSRAMDVLGRVGLAKRAHSQIRTLSKGMRQRVGLAGALLHDPEVLILDEPTIGLDPIQVLELREVVMELGKEHTVMFSTHILSEAEQVCDRVVIINQGEVRAQGTPTELRAEMERGSRILVRTTEAPEKALELVKSVAGVAEAVVERDSILIYPSSADLDPRPALATTLANQGFHLLEVRPAANNLEEIFLEVTRRSASQIAEDEAEEAAEAAAEAASTAESEN